MFRRRRTGLCFLFSSVLLATAYPQAVQPQEEPIRVGGDVKPPTKVKHVPPVYPTMASLLWVQGIVILEAVIDTQGAVSNVQVLRSIPLLDEAAINAIQSLWTGLRLRTNTTIW